MSSYPTVNPADYATMADTWWFAVAGTPYARCEVNFDAELGVMCQYDPPKVRRVFVTASTSAVGAVSAEGPIFGPGFPNLPPNTRIALPNGIECVSPAYDTIACLASPPPNAPAGATDARGRPFGQHGFVFNLTRTPTLF